MPLDQAAFQHWQTRKSHCSRVQDRHICSASRWSMSATSSPEQGRPNTRRAADAMCSASVGVEHGSVGSTMITCPREGTGTRRATCQSRGPKASRRRGGIEPLRVSTPHELKSCPSTSPTHPGPPAKNRPASVKAKARPLAGSLPCARGKAHMTGGLRGFAGPDPRGMRLRQSA